MFAVERDVDGNHLLLGARRDSESQEDRKNVTHQCHSCIETETLAFEIGGAEAELPHLLVQVRPADLG